MFVLSTVYYESLVQLVLIENEMAHGCFMDTSCQRLLPKAFRVTREEKK